MIPFSRLALTCTLLVGVACEQNHKSAVNVVPGLTARGVIIELARSDGGIRTRGENLSIRQGGAWMQLEGDASVTVGGNGAIEARADHITVNREEEKIELAGNVHARFRIPAMKGSDVVDK
ncbi:MAG: hypothetical protein GY854_02830 [Deltaproteobacteria bacterium]|nr:hypothetical protein [Deltaproteobacteria bacterium]